MEHSLPVTEAAKAGSILTAERVRQGLTVEAVADKLRLRPYQIEALESGDFSRLPQGTFLRGFMKNYARLLSIEPERVLAALKEQVPTAEADPNIVVPSQNIRYRADGQTPVSGSFKGLILAIAALVVAFLGVYVWMSLRGASAGTSPPALASKATKGESLATPAAASAATPTSASAAPATTTTATSATTTAGVVNTPLPTQDVPTTAGASVASNAASGLPSLTPSAASGSPATASQVNAASPTATRAAAAGELPAAPALRAGEGNTTFTFAAKSWLQIKDARGRVVHQREHEPGSSFSLDVPVGAGLVVGNSKSVRMLRGGREIDLALHTDVNVARLKAE